MDRDFLKELGLEKEAIDKIMKEHGKSVNDLKEQVNDLKENVNSLKNELEVDKDIIEQLYNEVDEKDESLKNLESITNEKNDLQMQLQMRDSNVKKEFEEFVTSKIKSSITEDKSFDDVLNEYKENNPQYFGETVVTKVQTSPDLSSENSLTSTDDIMNNILRNK